MQDATCSTCGTEFKTIDDFTINAYPSRQIICLDCFKSLAADRITYYLKSEIVAHSFLKLDDQECNKTSCTKSALNSKCLLVKVFYRSTHRLIGVIAFRACQSHYTDLMLAS